MLISVLILVEPRLEKIIERVAVGLIILDTNINYYTYVPKFSTCFSLLLSFAFSNVLSNPPLIE